MNLNFNRETQDTVQGDKMQDKKTATNKQITLMILGGFILFIALMTPFVAIHKTPQDKIALSYGGGLIESNHYQGTIQPASGLRFNGYFDKWYEYPITQRSYIVSSDPNEGDKNRVDVITAYTKDKLQVQVELAIYFKLNTDLIREFHENVGIKYSAWKDDGWRTMLEEIFRQPLENIVQETTKNYTMEELTSSSEAFDQVQKAISSKINKKINSSFGEDYFCGSTYQQGSQKCPNLQMVLKKITIPQAITNAYEAQKKSEAKVVTAQNDAKAKEERAKGELTQQQILQASLSDQYLAYLNILAKQKCAENTNCTLVITDTGVNVNVGK